MDTNHLAGVYIARKKDNSIYYRSSMTVNSKHISLGSYDTASDAHNAYLEACNLLNDATITIDDYTSSNTLEFSKWVCLINLRDNHIYIANPIYIRPKMFYYYLSKDEVLKFDADDLFFYSSHKIMKRGGHLFVSNFGLQLNIASRYGIKNHAVLGKDYKFVNGDTSDYRYSNIEILNPYQGVTEINKKGRIRYKSIIHINGNFVIGTYKTKEEAAIAYNKATDYLKKKGYKKNYPTNFVEDLSPSEYARIYSDLKISSKIINLEI